MNRSMRITMFQCLDILYDVLSVEEHLQLIAKVMRSMKNGKSSDQTI